MSRPSTVTFQGIAGRKLQDLPPLALESVRALPEPEDEDGPEGADDPKLKQLLLDLLPDDGSAMGNGSLTDAFVARACTELRLQVAATTTSVARRSSLPRGSPAGQGAWWLC